MPLSPACAVRAHPLRPPVCRLRGGALLLAVLAHLAALALLTVPAPPVRAAPPRPPFAVAVLPFADLRHPDQPSWLGRYLQERIAKALLRAPQVAVLAGEAAAQWQRKLGLPPGEPLRADALAPLGVTVAVSGSTQEVLGLVEVRLHAVTAEGDLLAGDAGRLRIALRSDPPAVALERVLGTLQAALLPTLPPSVPLAEPRPPADWQAVETLYTLLGQVPVPGDRAARPERVARLRPLAADPALGPRAREALAGALLEQALLYQPEGAGRELMLGDALQQATLALQADPRDTQRLALKAELHFFLKQYFEAKTDASVARLRNPLEGLAYVVLGLVAGLSTGEASERFKRALAIDPFLRTDARPAGSAPFQGGILEPSFAEWERLRANRGLARPDDTPALLAQAIDRFEQRQYDEAERLFKQAAERDELDPVPLLYLNRILIARGHPEEALPGLRRLLAGNPQDPDLLRALATALAASGEHAEAVKTYRQLLADHADDLPGWRGLAASQIALENWPDALTALRAVLQAAPDDAQAWLQLGTVQAHLEDWAGAQGALERALQLRPAFPAAQRALDAARAHAAMPDAPGAPEPASGRAPDSVPESEPAGGR